MWISNYKHYMEEESQVLHWKMINCLLNNLTIVICCVRVIDVNMYLQARTPIYTSPLRNPKARNFSLQRHGKSPFDGGLGTRTRITSPP